MDPDKTKGMNSQKITPFLMCPATVGDASGGTPAACAAGGGHIKKDAWVSAHEAAVRGLALMWMGDGHGSSPRLCLGLGELWPDQVPVVWAEVLQRASWIGLVDAHRQRRACCLQTSADLVEVLLLDAKLKRDFPALLGLVGWDGHAQM